jgi:hypothetical protein
MEKMPTPENIDSLIEKLLAKLDDYNELYDEFEEEWYSAEMEARVGKDREAAKAGLEKLLEILEAEKQKRTK